MTANDFDKEFYRLVREGKGVQDAFWWVNEKHFDKYGEYRYSDYNSYRVSKWARMRRKKR